MTDEGYFEYVKIENYSYYTCISYGVYYSDILNIVYLFSFYLIYYIENKNILLKRNARARSL